MSASTRKLAGEFLGRGIEGLFGASVLILVLGLIVRDFYENLALVLVVTFGIALIYSLANLYFRSNE